MPVNTQEVNMRGKAANTCCAPSDLGKCVVYVFHTKLKKSKKLRCTVCVCALAHTWL